MITHGNGPQVGDILVKNESAKEKLPIMPLDICGAETQGMIGYMFQRSLDIELHNADIDIPVVTIITQTLVDSNDPAIKKPSKPIGPFYTALKASQLRDERGWTIINDSGRGYRRAVPSPAPIAIYEEEIIKRLFNNGALVVAAGGGGIPIIKNNKDEFIGLEAVIDKDHTAALLANLILADTLLILTDVDYVYLNYGKNDQKPLKNMKISEAKKYLKEEQFATGSMRPKIEAALDFLQNGGKKSIITSLDNALQSLQENKGTIIEK